MGQFRLLVLLLAIALCGCDDTGVVQTDTAQAATDHLDLSRYRRTFLESFEDFDVSAWGPHTRWIAHTPWAGDFGDAAFADPVPGFPFQTASSTLRIEARKTLDGKWHSGLISSRDHWTPGGSGFAQAMGYFEMEAKLPPGPGTWPAFWLVGETDTKGLNPEIDVMEYYGVAPDAYRVTVHMWAPDARKFGDGAVIKIPPNAATTAFNRYGVDIADDFVTFYFNRKAVWRTPTRPEFRRPMYMLADLALGSGWPTDKTPDPSFMYIKSIAAYERQGGRS